MLWLFTPEVLQVAISEALTSGKKLSWSVWDNREITSVKLLALEARCQLTSSVGNSTSVSGGINIAPSSDPSTMSKRNTRLLAGEEATGGLKAF